MRLWRIGKTKYVGDRLGAKLAGGRWSSRGVAVLYFAATKSLAALEVFVHLEPEDLPEPLSAISVDVPEAIFKGRARRTIDELPPSWRRYPAPAALQAVGNTWVKGGVRHPGAPLRRHPRGVEVPAQPEPPGVRDRHLERSKPFALDPRLWRRT